MRKSLSVCALLIMATSLPFSVAASVYCPAAEAIHCSEGDCKIDSPYNRSWHMDIIGKLTCTLTSDIAYITALFKINELAII